MYPLPHNVYQNKKALRAALIFYVLLALFFAWAMLKSMRRAMYLHGPDDTGMFLLLLIILVVVIIRTWRKLYKKEPLITLEPSGIRFNEKQFKDLGFIKWADVITCKEISMSTYMLYSGNGIPHLVIDVKDRLAYANRIEDVTQRSRFLKRSKKYDALLWINVQRLDTDMVTLKRTVFQMKDKMELQR